MWCDSCNILETGRSFHGQASPGYTLYQFLGSDYSKEKQNPKALETLSRTSPQIVGPGPAASHPWRVDWKCRVSGPAQICWLCICWLRSGVCTALLWPGSADSARWEVITYLQVLLLVRDQSLQETVTSQATTLSIKSSITGPVGQDSWKSKSSYHVAC